MGTAGWSFSFDDLHWSSSGKMVKQEGSLGPCTVLWETGMDTRYVLRSGLLRWQVGMKMICNLIIPRVIVSYFRCHYLWDYECMN